MVASSYYIRRNKFAESFAALKVGDTKETVLQLLGRPEKVVNCNDPSSNNEFDRKCVEGYWYWSFMERWVVYLDKDGKVFDKVNNVSF